jgi:uridine kinase
MKAFRQESSRTRNRNKPVLVLIAGGSGSGKTWLANRLWNALRPHAAKLSLDDFYLDRSHLSKVRRAKLNFDHPRAIDWAALETVLRRLLAGRPAQAPLYDFKTHSQRLRLRMLKPRKFLLMDGLWLLRRRRLRQLASLSIFLHCPLKTRLRRRLKRDLASRGRTRRSVETQFQSTVEPMHKRYVAPQSKWADLVFERNIGSSEIRRLVNILRAIPEGLHPGRGETPGAVM